MTETNGHRLSIDSHAPVRIGMNDFSLRGWFLPATGSGLFARLRILVDDKPALVQHGLPREDVAEHFGDPGARHCGFVARFATASTTVNIRIEFICNGLEPLDLLSTNVSLDRTEHSLSSCLQWMIDRECEAVRSQKQTDTYALGPHGKTVFSVFFEKSNCSPNFINTCIASVLRQSNPSFELILPTFVADAEIAELVEGDSRIRRLDKNSGGREGDELNAFVAQSLGEFVIILPSADELHPTALLELSKVLELHPGLDIIYSDEDSISACGERSKPIFKPGLDLEMLAEENYLGGVLALRRTALLEIGGFERTTPELRDWDAVLRLTNSRHFKTWHIAKFLYHRRESVDIIRSSGGSSRRFKSKLQFVQDHLSGAARGARVEIQDTAGRVRIRYAATKSTSLGVFLRAADGQFQEMVLRPNVCQLRTAFYGIAEISVRRSELPAAFVDVRATCTNVSRRLYNSRLITITDVPEDILLFINGPLEGVNHYFFDEIVGQTVRLDVGLITGVSLNHRGDILHSGFLGSADGALVDPFAGCAFSRVSDWLYFQSPRQVEAISYHYFAVRRSLLADIGGVSIINADRMDRVLLKLIQHARAMQLKILVTPAAIASFSCSQPHPAPEGVSSQKNHPALVNGALLSFLRHNEGL